MEYFWGQNGVKWEKSRKKKLRSDHMQAFKTPCSDRKQAASIFEGNAEL